VPRFCVAHLQVLLEVKEACLLHCLYHFLGSGALSLDLIISLLVQVKGK